jgi:arylsulfatase A-like enzyme
VRDQLVANVDLAPTILDVARAVPDIEQDGSSVLPIASDGSASDARSFLLELQRVPGLDEEARERSRDLRKFFEPETVFAVRSPGFFYAEHPNGEVELYDLDRDPDQLENVATDAEYGSALTELEGRLRILKSCRGAACR